MPAVPAALHQEVVSWPEIGLSELERGIARLESRQVFGKIVVTF